MIRIAVYIYFLFLCGCGFQFDDTRLKTKVFNVVIEDNEELEHFVKFFFKKKFGKFSYTDSVYTVILYPEFKNRHVKLGSNNKTTREEIELVVKYSIVKGEDTLKKGTFSEIGGFDASGSHFANMQAMRRVKEWMISSIYEKFIVELIEFQKR